MLITAELRAEIEWKTGKKINLFFYSILLFGPFIQQQEAVDFTFCVNVRVP